MPEASLTDDAALTDASGDWQQFGGRSERKQSSGDLHSRLKTRKLLGVGGTDDGDVHRSKLSQILGHSDQLYQQALPRGVKEWQLACAMGITCVAALALLKPHALLPIESGEHQCSEQHHSLITICRLYGACMLVISCALWLACRSQDRGLARVCLAGTAALFAIHLAVLVSERQATAVGRLCQVGLTAAAIASASMCGRLFQLQPLRGPVPW